MTSSFARTLRQNPTPAEKRLWRLLYPLRTGGFHFRKQAPIGPFIADFACHAARLVIEVDGDSHGTAAGEAHDRRRDEFLRDQGYAILRFTNREVLANGEGVLQVIARTVAAATPLPASPTRGEVKPGGPAEHTLPLVGRDGEGVAPAMKGRPR
jgi:very-short-patch-repair endonuclease